MSELLPTASMITDISTKGFSIFGWLLCPGLLKASNLNAAKAQADIAIEMESYKIAKQRDHDMQSGALDLIIQHIQKNEIGIYL